jgi:hypothetical protein
LSAEQGSVRSVGEKFRRHDGRRDSLASFVSRFRNRTRSEQFDSPPPNSLLRKAFCQYSWLSLANYGGPEQLCERGRDARFSNNFSATSKNLSKVRKKLPVLPFLFLKT